MRACDESGRSWQDHAHAEVACCGQKCIGDRPRRVGGRLGASPVGAGESIVSRQLEGCIAHAAWHAHADGRRERVAVVAHAMARAAGEERSTAAWQGALEEYVHYSFKVKLSVCGKNLLQYLSSTVLRRPTDGDSV